MTNQEKTIKLKELQAKLGVLSDILSLFLSSNTGLELPTVLQNYINNLKIEMDSLS